MKSFSLLPTHRGGMLNTELQFLSNFGSLLAYVEAPEEFIGEAKIYSRNNESRDKSELCRGGKSCEKSAFSGRN